MTTRTPLLVCLALIAGSFAIAEEPALVEQALQSMETTTVDDWFFTETTVSQGTTFVKHHDPTKPEGQRWTLVSVDGREPTEGERKQQAREEAHAEEEDTDQDDDGEIRAMIDSESLTLVEETASHAVYRFRPVAEDEDDEKLFDHLDATLRVVKAGPYVESLEMRSREPFSPGFGVKMKEFAMRLTFAPVGPEATALPETVNIHIVGRAFLVKKVDETVEVTYSDYRRPGD